MYESDATNMQGLAEFAIENLADAAYFVLSDGSIIYANAAATKMLGYTREEFLSLHIYDLNPDVTPEQWPGIWSLLQKAGKRTFEANHATKDGRVLPVEVWANLILFDGREMSCSFARDATERRQLDLRLRQSEKMKAIGQLAGGVAHDFNNQLSAVTGYADLLLDLCRGQAEAEDYVEQIQSAVKRAAELTQKLLAFSRLEVTRAAVIDLHTLIVETTSIVERSFDKKINVTQRLRATKPLVEGDPSGLQNAILNLALNARDAMAAGGQLTISSENVVLDADACKRLSPPVKPGLYVVIAVTDDGYGIAPEHLERIFEPFFTTKPKGQGTGLGLATTYATVKTHQGAISVYSEVGKGTEVRLYLPTFAGQMTEAESTASELLLPRKMHVMVVEDEEALRNLAALILRSLGCEVTVFANGAPAVEFYCNASASIDLVLLDMCMPVMDGTATFHALRKLRPDVKVLIASGYSLARDTQALLETGAAGFVQKPYRKAVLAAELTKLIGDA
ncbi:MAG TPA: ATP-binding protein [Polyangiaceae bacterium]|nr:ATP-binding protein [Polyangiaceae bacterium]